MNDFDNLEFEVSEPKNVQVYYEKIIPFVDNGAK